MQSVAGRVVAFTLITVSLMSAMGLAASQTFINETGRTVTGIKIEFSKSVMIIKHDFAFPDQSPRGLSQKFEFSGGNLRNLGRFTITWLPSLGKVVNYEWVKEGAEERKQVTTVPEVQRDTFEVDLGYASNGIEAKAEVQRQILRHQLPFDVKYEVSFPTQTTSYSVYWDLDKYIDSDNDGNSANDRDREGTSISLTYTENYNPTITLHIVDDTGKEVAVWENMIRDDFSAGETVYVDGERLLAMRGITSPPQTVTWKQLHMKQNSFDYVTEYTAPLQATDKLVSWFSPQYAGRYVYSLEVKLKDGSHVTEKVSGWVIEPVKAHKPVVIMMADLWNNFYDNKGNIVPGCFTFFTNYDVKQKLRFLRNEGFDRIMFCPVIATKQVTPVPILDFQDTDMMSDTELRWLAEMVEKPQITVGSMVSGHGAQKNADNLWTDYKHLSRQYFEQYFRQYTKRMVQLATLAQQEGMTNITIGAGHPYLWGLGGMGEANSSTARYVASQWKAVIAAVRDVFSGAVGLGFFYPKDDPAARLLAGVPDYMEYLMGNYCMRGNCSYARLIAATNSAEDLRKALGYFYSATAERVSISAGVPLAFPLAAASFLNAARVYGAEGHEDSAYASWKPVFGTGGYGDEILNGTVMAPFQPSFRDQTLLLETFLPVLAKESSVRSIQMWGEYWKLIDFHNFTPINPLEIHQANNSSLQGKPGFQVVKLWASILDPNDRLAYRHVIAPREETKIVIGDSQFIADSSIDWASLPYLVKAPEGYTPATYWGSDGQVDISTSKHWNLPGHDLKGIKCDFNDKGLAIRWETYKPDIKTGFTFELQFHPPTDPDTTLYIDVNPRDERAEVQLQPAGKNYYLQSSIAAFVIEKQRTTLYLKDISLPEGAGWLHNLRNWPVSAFVLLLTHLGNEYYEFPTECNTLGSLNGTSAGETTTSNNPSFVTDILVDVPTIFQYPSTPDIGFYCDGDQDFSHAQFWGRPGSKVASLKTVLTNDALVAQVDLHDGDHVGRYRYIISYNFPNSGRMLIFLDPFNAVADVARDVNNVWTWIAKMSGAYFGKGTKSVYTAVPLNLISNYVTLDMLKKSKVDFHIDYIEGGRRELFFFPSPSTQLQFINKNILTEKTAS